VRDTAVTLSARAKATDTEIAQNRRLLEVKEQTIADLEERLRLSLDLVRLSTRKQAVQSELAELEAR
jgi:hypothetical protein